MSTNKTQNYNLHSWLPQDEFHLTEINENFAKLDEELALELEALQDTFADEVAEIKTTLGGKADKTALAALSQTVAGKAEVVAGTYTGSGQYGHHIDLARAPLSVHIETPDGYRSTNLTNGGLFTKGSGGIVTLDDTGFTIGHTSQLNYPGSRYAFMAVLSAG